MDDRQIWRIALEQSAIDSSCQPEDFLAGEPRVVRSKPDPKARAYLDLPFGCDLTSYGSNVVASVGPAAEAAARRYVEAYPAEHCFETPHLHVLEGELRQLGLSICHMAEYFLPDLQRMERLTCPYETRLLEPGQLAELYQPQWGNALCEKRKHLDQLAVGAFHRGELVGLAGCSADCDAMWQIGVDVLPAYRGQGIAGAVTSQLAHAVFQRGKVPFYCAAWSNIKSVRNALRCGFKPAWVQLTAKPVDQVEKANQRDGAEKEREHGTI